MKYNFIDKYIWLATFLVCMLLSATSCKDDVGLPMQTIELSDEMITASAFAANYSVDVQANCDWTIEMDGNDGNWADISLTKAVGMATVDIKLENNDTEKERTLILTVVANRNRSVAKRLTLVQNPSIMEGYVSISDIRTMAESNGTYTFS